MHLIYYELTTGIKHIGIKHIGIKQSIEISLSADSDKDSSLKIALF